MELFFSKMDTHSTPRASAEQKEAANSACSIGSQETKRSRSAIQLLTQVLEHVFPGIHTPIERGLIIEGKRRMPLPGHGKRAKASWSS